MVNPTAPLPVTPTNCRQRIWSLAWPMIVANLSIPLLGVVDTAILGHLADNRYLSAVAIGSSMLAFIYWGFGFLRMGTTGASAHAEDPTQAAALLLKALLLAPLISALIWLCRPIILDVGLQLMNTPASLHSLAEQYLNVRLLSVVAVLANYVAVGWLIGQQQTRWPLVIAVSTNLCNIALDILFIVMLEMHSLGAAIASAISEFIGLGLACYALRSPLREAFKLGIKSCLAMGISVTDFLRSNLNLFVRTIALLFSFSFFTSQSASHGEVVLAANTILLQLAFAAAYGMDGFAHAAEALVGSALKQRLRSEFILICRECARLSLYTALLASGGLLLCKPLILSIMTDLPAVTASASAFYVYLVAMPLVSVASYTLDGIFVGAMRTRSMQWAMLGCVFGVYLPTWYLLNPDWGNHAIWLALITFNAARGLSLAAIFAWEFSARRWQP